MNKKSFFVLANAIIGLSLVAAGCGKASEAAGAREPAKAEVMSKASKKDDNQPIKIKDIEGAWEGQPGFLQIYLVQDGRGEITFSDDHGVAPLYFEGYKEKNNALLFEGKFAESEKEETFNVSVEKTAKNEISVKIGNVSYPFKKVDEKKIHSHDSTDEFLGSETEPAEKAALSYLQQELQELSDSSVLVGTLSNHFDGKNHVSTYITYTGVDSSVDSIRSALLKKVIEMNKIADKYRWLGTLTINSYKGDISGTTEKNKQTNGLTSDSVSNSRVAYQISTIPEDRWLLSKRKVEVIDLAAYVNHFGAQSPFLQERDSRLSSLYPVYRPELLDPLQAFKDDYVNDKFAEFQRQGEERKKVLNSSNISSILGYWHDKRRQTYMKIVYDENQGMIYQGKAGMSAGGPFTVIDANGSDIVIQVGSKKWTMSRNGNQLIIKIDGATITLEASTAEEARI